MNIEDFRQLANSGTNPNESKVPVGFIEEAIRIRLVAVRC